MIVFALVVIPALGSAYDGFRNVIIIVFANLQIVAIIGQVRQGIASHPVTAMVSTSWEGQTVACKLVAQSPAVVVNLRMRRSQMGEANRPVVCFANDAVAFLSSPPTLSLLDRQIALYCFPDWALMRNYVDLSYRCTKRSAICCVVAIICHGAQPKRKCKTPLV